MLILYLSRICHSLTIFKFNLEQSSFTFLNFPINRKIYFDGREVNFLQQNTFFYLYSFLLALMKNKILLTQNKINQFYE